jgi:hypothetical protein
MIRMKNHFLVCALLVGVYSSACAATTLPKDVRSFMTKRDICEHFRGEFPDPPDPERAKDVNDNIDKYCTGTDAQLAKLKHRYAKRHDVMRKLNAYEENIEAQ